MKGLRRLDYFVAVFAFAVRRPPLVTAAAAAVVDCWCSDDFVIFVPALPHIAG